MYLTGDFAGLQQLTANLAELSSIPSQASREAADSIDGRLKQQFIDETDPYGNAWDELQETTVARKGGDSRILQRSDAMAQATEAVTGSGAGVIASSNETAQWHQWGTKNMVARPVLPGEDTGLPETWEADISTALQNAADRRLGGR